MTTNTTSTASDTTKKRKARAESLGNFHVALFDAAHKLQQVITGLLSNENALRLARVEAFTSSVNVVINTLHHARLFSGENAEEEVSFLTSYAK